MQETINQRVGRVVRQHFIDQSVLSEAEAAAVSDDTDLFTLGGDSLDFVELTVALEDEFGIEIHVDDDFSTINDIAKIIGAHRNGKHI